MKILGRKTFYPPLLNETLGSPQVCKNTKTAAKKTITVFQAASYKELYHNAGLGNGHGTGR